MGVNPKKVLVGIALLVLAIPALSEARVMHYFTCTDCHRTALDATGLSAVCLKCHDYATRHNVAFSDGTTTNQPVGFFTRASDESSIASSQGTSHKYTGGDAVAAAGAAAPTNPAFSGTWNASGGKIVCSRCHNPHGDKALDPNSLKLANGNDEMCLDCHRAWNKNNVDADLTHPVGVDYATATNGTNDPANNLVDTIVSTQVRLVGGKVSCTSCHGTHYTDSNASTADGKANRAGLTAGDGHMLRGDGPARTGVTRNGATGTAQLRSNLCQSCHQYELHGQGLSGDHKIGCLECHGGHSYNGGTPSAFVLRSQSPGPVPTRPNGVNSGSDSVVTFPLYPSGGSTRSKWADETQGTANGFCEKCHGDCNSAAMIAKATEHTAGNSNACNSCHKHNDPANLYSFNRDASAATCGQCHGFPPYLNSPGDRPPGGTGVDGGYAINKSADPNTPYDYVSSTTHEKDETTTGHKVHAGRDLPTSPANSSATDWYFVGVSGIDNCKVCHGPDAGSEAGGHRIAPATRPNTFRDVPFDSIAKTGGMTPAYNVNSPWTCTNVYCHTNGAPYNGASRPNRVYTFVNTSPPWVGNGTTYNNGGYGSIHGKAYECYSCHGNDLATMGAAQKQNSAAHLAHLGGATTLNMLKNFSCSVCHVQSAASGTALTANAMDGRLGGKHVNGAIDVNFDGTALGGDLAASTYANSTGVCSTYCHNVTGLAGAATADWDVATDMQCDSCHGGKATDSAGDGGYGPIATGSHSRHILTSGTGPKLQCAECHGTGSDAGTHAGHFDGIVNMKVAVNAAVFGSDSVSICKECHGYDAEAGEVLPVWGNVATTDCATCHAGLQCGATFNSKTPKALDRARITGHNRPTASGAYAQSANPAANLNCAGCHTTDDAGHWDGVTGDDLMLKSGSGFPAIYAGSENAFCGACHGATGTATRKNINTHRSKLCVACHNVHGDANIQMIWTNQVDQVSNDPSVTGKYAANVIFLNSTTFTAGNTDSYDEDDGVVGGAGEVNGDDLCATCHTVAAGTAHNNADNSTGNHYQGGDCFTCHATHTDATDAFKVGVGTACNDCHGFPPATGAHRKGTLLTDPELHSNTASNDKDIEDRSDCAWCHTGADLYTYDLTADQAAVGARGNHAKGQANRRTVLATAVGYETTNFSCTTACHASSATDGAWSDVSGLNCNACHYAAAVPASAGNVTAGNSEAVSAVHNKHFDKNNMTCAQCHDVSYSPTIAAIRGVLTHIIAPNYTGPGNDGTLIQGRANATLDEATVTRASMTYSGGAADGTGVNNTCAGTGFGLGCHASAGSAATKPDWDVAIPATSAGCVMCHTETDSAAYNPTSGLHDNSPSGPTVTGNSHDGSFDNGSAGTADCVTCHTASPTAVAANHVNGTLNTGTAITVAAAAGYTQASGTCATTCHSAGTVWAYKWSTTAYATNGSECANCHGDYASGWLTGVAPHTEFPTRGNKHNNVGNLTYPCSDCHAIGSAGYKWVSKWDPTGINSHHGNDKITMNQVTGTNTFAIDTVPNPDRAGCTTTSCHQNDSAHNFRITTTTLLTETVAGNAPSVSCSGCHGGYVGTNANGYWPDGANVAGDNLVEDNSGAHLKHMTALAQAKYGETIAQLLTDNGNGTADAKQKFLCAYCHTNPGSDADHGLIASLPAEVNSMYAQWDLTRSTPDNGVFDGVTARTCATVDCHFNKTTPTTPTNFSWYGGATGACILCHLDVTAEAKHTAHTGAAATFGRAIGCADCHQAATNWSTNTPPASGHLNGTYSIAGGVVFTYSAYSCGTNACHEDGKGGAPKTNPYPWNGVALANCTICHDGSPTTDAHAKHLAAKVSTYVSGSCNDCHPAATNAAHINDSVSYAGKISAAPGNGSCTNTCHLSAEAGDWTGGSAAIACGDCHSGSGASAYIGGDKTSVAGPNYLPQYAMHLTVPTVTGKVHTDTGLATTCATCHSAIVGLATHVDGLWNLDSGTNTDRGMFAAFTDGSPATCATACHSAGASWRYKWSATAANTNGTECNNCHGMWGAWNTGVGHAVNATRGNSSNHNSVGGLTYACTACHVIGATTNTYKWTSKWDPTGINSSHGNGQLTMNSNGTTHARHENPIGTWKSGCKGCHDGPSNDGIGADDGLHDFPVNIATAPSTVRWVLEYLNGDVAATGGGCDGCHGSGGSFAPNGSRGNVYPDRPGKHAEHIAALSAKGVTGTTACNYCHPYSSGSSYVVGEHNDNLAPATLPNATSTYYKRIVGAGNDGNGLANGSGTSYVTCSNIDCHFDMPVTPHWYTDNVAPAAVTLTAVAGPKPRSVKVTWTAPGDDNNVADTTAYVYDLRIGADAATSQNFGLTTNYAGNLPAAYKQGYASEAVIQNLNVGTTYYFTLKTRDTAGNWSVASNTVSAAPTADAVAPSFGGLNQALKADAGGTVYLTWTAAEDHTMPITYKVWQKAESAGALNMNVDAPILTGVKAHDLVLTGLTNDTIYNFGVRACDNVTPTANCDTNTQVLSATPTAEPAVTKTYHTYRTNGSATLVKDGAAGTALTAQALPQTFTTGANNTYSVNYVADTFAIYINANTSGSATVTATLGYSTTGSDFTSLGVSKAVTVAKRASRVYQFKLAGAAQTIISGRRLAVQLTQTGSAVTVNYGSAANRGDLTIAEQIVNAVPTNPAVNAVVSGANVNVTWTAATDSVDGLADTVHYDLFGSDDNGANYRYLIARDIPAATTNYSWDTQSAGIGGSATVAVKLLPGDGYGHYTGAGTTVTGLAVNNSADNVAPGAITDLVARPRPKSGSVELTWTAQGDDLSNNGRASYYDIRYSTAPITEGNFATATQCVNEPSPDFGGKIQSYEVTGLTPGTTYYFAVKTVDDGGKISPISTAKSAGTDQAVGGPRCGMCHTTAPSIVESVGNHKLHGFTLKDCTKCHGAAAATYGLDHQDGLLKMGYGPGGPVAGVISTTTVANDTITYTDPTTLNVMYRDVNGYGGFGNGNYASVGDGVDNGTCINFGAMGVGGCHSFAGTDPDGAGSVFPTLAAPTWTEAASLNCANCHGNPSRTTDTFYSRAFDATTANGGIVPEQVKGAPAADNHGNYIIAAGPAEGARKYIGQHEKHLNYSFRFSKGDSCNLCHAGNYRDVNDLDGKHANGDVDVKLDLVAAGPNAVWLPGTATTAGSCSNLDANYCHPKDILAGGTAPTPKWDTTQNFDCIQCHGMGGTTPSHVTDPAGGVTLANSGWATDPMPGNCTYCHFGGHPRDTVGGTALILANSSQVGLAYRSGGIHLKANIGGRGAKATEAELCWGCHDANSISEWGADTGSDNAGTVPPNASNYDYGQIYTSTAYTTTTSNWTAAYWKSPVASFDYKKGAVQSTHSTSETGTSTVTGVLKARVETKDTVDKIRCSNCHDVHNLNKAPNDTYTGKPYLRGTWIRNPYPEDGAPWNKAYTSVNDFGPVPRGGVGNNQQGGYQIDQNNSYPTAGMSLATSAGLCTLCHGSNVDAMDKKTGEGFWVGTNGHSNATLGGTASAAANIFGYGVGGRPTPSGANLLDDTQAAADVPDMGVQYVNINGVPGTTRAYLYRSKRAVKFNPLIVADYAYQRFDWGVTVDATTTDVGYHAFTCSKCHNPHASRLPKLMITNCLDTGRNTWQNTQGSLQNFWSSTADNGEYTATHNTAQNCHRFDAADNVGGWNTVTPW